jgi:hypothetical protein
MPAKVFEYLAARKPILAIAPRGEVWNVLADYPLARRLEPADVAGICDAIAGEIQIATSGGRAPLHGSWDPSPFDRRNQAAQLAGLLNALAG